jgi:hypothetical protein
LILLFLFRSNINSGSKAGMISNPRPESRA